MIRFDRYTFPTAKALKIHTRRLIHELGVTASVRATKPSTYIFFRMLIKHRHPCALKVKGIRDFEIRRSMYGTLDVVCKYSGDRSPEMVSLLNRCVTGEKKNLVNRAFRSAVHEQIQEFRKLKSKHNRCVRCGFYQVKLTINHVKKFRHLVYRFCKENNLKLGNKDVYLRKADRQITFVDKDLESRWQKFHFDNAQLRFLCGDCNVRVG